MKKILAAVKKDLKPSKNYDAEVNKVVRAIERAIKELKIKAEVKIGGSYAKKTYIKNDFDVDLFIRYNKTNKNSKLSDLTEIILDKAKIFAERVHGSRDYFQTNIKIKNKLIIFEIVPVYKIKNHKELVNVTDASPLHVDYVLKKIKKNSKLPDEIRLTKQFCKANNIYGAESYINGISGHVIDLLIINYGSFENLIKAVTKWEDKTIIDLEKHHKNPEKKLNKAKTISPLIMVDPVQPLRNAAAALSRKQYNNFKVACDQFMFNPSKEYFKKSKLTKQSFLKGITHEDSILFELTITPLEGKNDVVYAKVAKVYEYIIKSFKKNHFELYKSQWDYENKIFLLVKNDVLPSKMLHVGPPSKSKHAKPFKQKHSKVIEEKGRLYTYVKTEFRTPKQLLTSTIKSKYIREKVKSIK